MKHKQLDTIQRLVRLKCGTFTYIQTRKKQKKNQKKHKNSIGAETPFEIVRIPSTGNSKNQKNHAHMFARRTHRSAFFGIVNMETTTFVQQTKIKRGYSRNATIREIGQCDNKICYGIFVLAVS